MHRKSKKNFRDYLKTKAEKAELSYQIYPKAPLAKNVVIGNLKTAKYVLMAHYDTPPRMPSFLMKSVLLLNIVVSLFPIFLVLLAAYFELPMILPLIVIILMLLYVMGIGIANKKNFNDNTSGILVLLKLMETINNDKVAYVFFDNEEKGLFGSNILASFLRKQATYKAYNKKFINFDCVGRGNLLGVAAFKKNKLAEDIIEIGKDNNNENIDIEYRKTSILEASDHMSFKGLNSVGIMCYNKKGRKYKIENIHSAKDSYISEENINYLVSIMTEYLEREKEHE